MFQMTLNHPTGSPLCHTLMKDFAITIKILKKKKPQKIIRYWTSKNWLFKIQFYCSLKHTYFWKTIRKKPVVHHCYPVRASLKTTEMYFAQILHLQFFRLSADFSVFRSFYCCLIMIVLHISILLKHHFQTLSFSMYFLLWQDFRVSFPPKHKMHMPKLTTKVHDREEQHTSEQPGTHVSRRSQHQHLWHKEVTLLVDKQLSWHVAQLRSEVHAEQGTPTIPSVPMYSY